MQLDVLRRQSGTQSPVVNSELERIQKLLREEVLKLRELMQAMKSFEVNAERLLGFISDTVERFRRETGISAEFVSELERGGVAAEGVPGTGAHCAGKPGQCAQAQRRAPCSGAAGAKSRQLAVDGGGRWPGVCFFRHADELGTGDNAQGAGGHPGKSTLAWRRTRDRIEPWTWRSAGSTDPADAKNQSWIDAHNRFELSLPTIIRYSAMASGACWSPNPT